MNNTFCPKIAILLSSFNGEKYIKEQLDSIINQKGSFNLNIIVRDDGSSDGTIKILEEYKNKGLLDWYSGKNEGPAQSFMDLILNCDPYDYYAFADQDDVWLPNKIERGINILKNDDVPRLYFSNATIVDQNLNVIRQSVYEKQPKIDLYTVSIAGGALGCTMMFNDAVVKKIKEHRRPETLVMHDSYILELTAAVRGKITYDANQTMLYRQHLSNTVGLDYGSIFKKIKGRLQDILIKPKVSVADQANEIVNIYYNELDADAISWLKKVSEYRDSFGKKLTLCFCKKTHYINLNMSFKLRASILLGNR